MELKRIGSYIETDEQGFLQSQADAQNINVAWLPAVEAVKWVYLGSWRDDIHSIYIRGSLAKGLAIEDTSDIDSFAVLEPGCRSPVVPEAFDAYATTVEQQVQQEWPFVAGVELGVVPFEEAQDRGNIYAFIIKVEAACIFGEDLAQSIAPFKLGPEVAFQTRYFRKHRDIFLSEYPKEPEHGKPELLNWMMRRFLRLGMELVMVEEGRYTRDLYLCYESFAQHYPEKTPEMYRALELAINPVSGQAIETFVERFGEATGHLGLRPESRRDLDTFFPKDVTVAATHAATVISIRRIAFRLCESNYRSSQR